MPNPDELIAILDRILNGSRDESEVAQLRQWLKVSGSTLQFVSQDGKFNTNIGQVQGGEIHLGDRHYQFDLEALRELLQPTTPLPDIDWQAVSQAMLEEQLRLTTNPLTSGEGISYRTEQVYVPLGLVERKRQTRRRDDVLPEQGSLLYEETEITQRFEHEQFLEQVLRQRQSPKSGGKRLAIIGEPGAGKTTLLQQIAQWVSEQVEGAIAIWVSLADLRGQELEPYLLERWLQAVAGKLGQAEASRQVKDAFVAQFQQGRVWLLLDGVDEMQVLSGNPLAEMSRQVRMGGLLSQARIVLSCRLNLWDGNRNALDTFDTYRTLEFSYPQQVEQFIGQWFGALPEGQETQAERLCMALKAPGKERIRDLVKNPLRLTLLCFNWYLGEGTLPKTKAGLYEQFVADFYEWKREQFPTTAKQRRQLNTALGELAREAIDKEATRFRLRHDFVCEFLGEPDEPNSLFQLALQLGWLNKVGVDAENPRRAVYVFFHPTFEEYFAALAIENWHYFLNHIPEYTSHQDASYRIFGFQWKEIFLLWLERNDIEKIQKNLLIKSLVEFKDGCGCFYEFQANFLAVISDLAEFLEPSQNEQHIEKVIKWGFGCFDSEKKQWRIYPYSIAKEARIALREANIQKVFEKLTGLLNIVQLDNTRQKILNELEEINSNLLELTTILKKLLHESQEYETRWQIAETLLRINPCNPEAIDAFKGLLKFQYHYYIDDPCLERIPDIEISQIIIILIELLKYSRKHESYHMISSALDHFQRRAIGMVEPTRLVHESLLSQKSDILDNITTLVELLDSSQNNHKRLDAIKKLGEIDFPNQIVIDALVRLLYKNLNQNIVRQTIISLSQIGIGSQPAIKGLIQFLCTTVKSKRTKDTIKLAVIALGQIASGNPDALSILIQFLCNSQDHQIIMLSAWSIKRILEEELFPQVVISLKDYISAQSRRKNLIRYQACYDVLWFCSKNITYRKFYKVWKTDSEIPPSIDETSRIVKNTYQIHLEDIATDFECNNGTNILAAATKQGIFISSSCQRGVCGKCMAKIKEGRVEQSDQYHLKDNQVEAGFILTCVAYPMTDCIIIINEDN